MPRRAPDLKAALDRAEEALRAFTDRPRPKLTKPCPIELARPHRTSDGRTVIECADRATAKSVDVGGVTAHISPSGKIQYPPQLRGVAVRDVPALLRDVKTATKPTEPVRFQKFMSPGYAVAKLYELNPELGQAHGRLWSSKIDAAYRAWLSKKMQGPRPTLESVYGSSDPSGLPNIDFLRAHIDRAQKNKKGPQRKIYGFTEALYASIPDSHRWEAWLPALKDVQAAVNEAAEEDEYVPKWLELRIPGRAGKELERVSYVDPTQPTTADEVLEAYRERGKLAEARKPRVEEMDDFDPNEEVPF
jgi:hypothetical protein